MKITPLSQKTLQPALQLLYGIFDNKPEDKDYPGYWLPESLVRNPPRARGKYAPLTSLYWVALEKEEVVGIVGLYQPKEDSESYWLGWYAVHPDRRKKGIGKKLLTFAIEKTKRDGKKSLKLYTSDSPKERIAQTVYEKMGFEEIDRYPKNDYIEIIREKKL